MRIHSFLGTVLILSMLLFCPKANLTDWTAISKRRNGDLYYKIRIPRPSISSPLDPVVF